MIQLFDTKTNSRAQILLRETAQREQVARTVEEILADVRQNGDDALLRYAKQFDGAQLTALEVSQEEKAAARASVEPALYATMERCAHNIRAFHQMQVREDFSISREDGVLLGQRILPLARVGIYVPGGRASYPSTVLMNAIPAKLAGVGEILMTTPCSADGSIPAAILAAAHIAGVDRIFKAGGAQAIAAYAYGTQSIPKVDKIVGPGNAFVATAKEKVFGLVNIDMIAGPSEILIISDGKSDPRFVAADLLSQAEHDPMAAAILLTDDTPLARAVQLELERQMALLPKESICRASIDANGKIVVTQSIAEALELANAIAPEHLELCVEEPLALLPEVKNAGSVFLGRYAPEALGDYFAGPNHTLPTSGTARFSSPLSVDDFIKKSSYVYYPKEALEKAEPDIVRFAECEGLRAHARSVSIRFEKQGEQAT